MFEEQDPEQPHVNGQEEGEIPEVVIRLTDAGVEMELRHINTTEALGALRHSTMMVEFDVQMAMQQQHTGKILQGYMERQFMEKACMNSPEGGH